MPGWIVADMDGTLVAPPGFRGGRYVAPTLAESPCLEPLCRWLRAGGKLLAVTSDDGNGPLRRIVEPLPAELRERVLLSTSDGAALFRVRDDGGVSAVEGYAEGMRLPSDTAYLEEVYAAAREIYLDYFRRLAAEPDLLASVGDELRPSYEKLLEQVRSGSTTLEEALCVDNLLRPAGVRSRGTLIWRTQAGPRSAWVVPEGTAAAEQGTPEQFRQLCARELVAPFTSVVLLGIPRRLSEPHCDSARPRLEGLGLVASRAPNSVWLKRPGANKGVPIRWLTSGSAAAEAFGFRARDAVAFGDNPTGNDGPLSEFSEAGMPFVSCGEDAWPGLHVGGLEAGTAAVVALLADRLEDDARAAAAAGRSPRRLGELGVDLAAVVGGARAAAAASAARPAEAPAPRAQL